MEQIIPDRIYDGLPCSMVAVGSALKLTDQASVSRLKSDVLKNDGYLSLDGMNRLIRANMSVKKKVSYKRNERPSLKVWAAHTVERAIVCVYGHFLYFDGKDYHSFFNNADDPIVAVWYLA